MGKSLLTSKTFWLNVLLGSAAYAQYLPPEYAAVIVAVSNLALRLMTKEPITSVV